MSRILGGVGVLLVAVTTPIVAQQAKVTGPRGATPQGTVARSTSARIDAPRLLPGTRADVFSTIQGNALTSTNTSLPNAIVRLRDARVGYIVGTQTTDQSGLFEFRTVDPGSYIVEIVDPNQASVLAASQVLNAGAGEAISAVVKLPFQMPGLAGVIGTRPGTLSTVTSQAASAGVAGSTTSGAPTCEQVQ